MRRALRAPPSVCPEGAATHVVQHRVPFYETDAMGIVHHSNYVRYLELGRIAFMDEHDRPYREYVAEDLHFATTHLEVSYHKSATYDDVLEIATWVEWVRGASIRIGYEIRRDGDLLVSAATNHGMVDGNGRPCRIPAPQRASLARAAGER